MFQLDNKIAVITGAGSGIGKAIAVMFARQKAMVHILDLNKENATEVTDEIKAQNGKAVIHTSNVADQKEVLALFEKIGPVNILINNAGIANIGKADTTKEEDFDKVMLVNVKGV